MSGWEDYISNLFSCSSSIRKAAIIGYPDGLVWAMSEGSREMKTNESELKKFVGLFDIIERVPTEGCDLEGVHYIVPWSDENLIFGKRDKTGFFAAKTKTAVLIALYEGDAAAGTEARMAVEELAKYLIVMGY